MTQEKQSSTKKKPLLGRLGLRSKPSKGPVKFGTFKGVFTPTVLTILGVIMYLREGWVVGNAGLLGAMGIIGLACLITLFTALSMSSITTNIRIGAGGAFSIIAQSLGLEAGGAIGIPLYFSQALVVAMYIFGFREGWVWIFPDHSPLLIDFSTFVVIFLIANFSTDFAFKLQYLILAIIIGSIVSILLAFVNTPVNTDVQLFGTYPGSPENNFQGANFWLVFAVFFPAVTGIMVGANMSGELENPRRNIPVGTIAAVLLSTVIYLGIAVVLALLATPEELVENYTILIDKAFWKPIVIAGLLGATFSSALSSLVGAPRILQALGENNILFFNKYLTRTTRRGEPRNGLIITTVIVMFALLMRDLNAIAPLLTMFFMITYAMINVVILIEQGLGQISFRPTLRVPMIVPLLGAIGCFFVMFIINPVFGLVAIGIVVAAYVLLIRKKMDPKRGDTRSGIFYSIAEWSAKQLGKLPEARERSWQPNMFIPAESVNDVVRAYRFIYSLAHPKGSIKMLGFSTGGQVLKLSKRLPGLAEYFQSQGISATSAMVQSEAYRSGVLTSMQSLKASFFRPNTLFLSLTDLTDRDEDIAHLLKRARNYGMGAYLFIPYQKVGLGLEKTLNLWIDFDLLEKPLAYRVQDVNLAMLTAHLLRRNWKAKLNIIVVIGNQQEEIALEERGKLEKEANEYLERLLILARMIQGTGVKIQFGKFENLMEEAPLADLNVFSQEHKSIEIETVRTLVNLLETSCVFTLDSGEENVLA